MDEADRFPLVIVTLIVVAILGIATAVALTLSHTSNNTLSMYEACIDKGNSPADCRSSWGDSGD